MEHIDTKRHRSHILVVLSRLCDNKNRRADVGAATGSIAGNREPTGMPIHMADIASDNIDRECGFSLMESKWRESPFRILGYDAGLLRPG
jgi:hypothetical protein